MNDRWVEVFNHGPFEVTAKWNPPNDPDTEIERLLYVGKYAFIGENAKLISRGPGPSDVRVVEYG